MKLSEIKKSSISDLLFVQARAMMAQGDGPNFSQMLENRINKIDEEIKKRRFNEYISKDDSYFSERHLMSWYNSIYKTKDKKEIKYQLESVHDNSGEIENAEIELDRELSDIEKDKLIKRFYKAIYNSLVFKRGLAIGYIDSCGKLNN